MTLLVFRKYSCQKAFFINVCRVIRRSTTKRLHLWYSTFDFELLLENCQVDRYYAYNSSGLTYLYHHHNQWDMTHIFSLWFNINNKFFKSRDFSLNQSFFYDIWLSYHFLTKPPRRYWIWKIITISFQLLIEAKFTMFTIHFE